MSIDFAPVPTLLIGPLYLEAGSVRHRFGRLWIPDGLHIWWGSRGVHLFWREAPRVVLDRDEATA